MQELPRIRKHDFSFLLRWHLGKYAWRLKAGPRMKLKVLIDVWDPTTAAGLA
jgi:hypothetical protein